MNKEREKRILVVDDEFDNASIFTLGLQDSGFEVDKFTDPLMALSSFKGGKRYDLLILDIKMPDMNGFELYEQIRSNEIFWHIRHPLSFRNFHEFPLMN